MLENPIKKKVKQGNRKEKILRSQYPRYEKLVAVKIPLAGDIMQQPYVVVYGDGVRRILHGTIVTWHLASIFNRQP